MTRHIILNPSAGKKEADDILARLRRLDDAVVHTTASAGHARELAKEAVRAGAATVVAAGGDGTVAEVINGIAGHRDRVRFGILPVGTGNDFARSLAIPFDLEQAVAVLDAGHTGPLDLVRVTRRGEPPLYFINVAVSGFSEEALGRIESGFKSLWGPLGYLRAAAEAIPEISPYLLYLDIDGRPEEEVTASIVVLANAGYMSAGVPVAPEARCDDGQLDILAMKPSTAAELLLLAPLVLTGTHMGSDQVFHRRARRVTIRSKPPLPFHVDDEFITYPELTFEVLPGALDVIVPAPKAEAKAIDKETTAAAAGAAWSAG